MVVPMRVPLELKLLPRNLGFLVRGYRSPARSATACVVQHAHRTDGPVPGEHLGPYELVRMLGEGAMGVVWLARDDRDGAEGALKLLRPGLPAAGGDRRRFLREARIASEVEHPNLVTIREAGEADG